MISQGEQWREIAGTRGLYEVSDQGRVRSWFRRGKVLKPRTGPYGRLMLTLHVGAELRRVPVNRLVAEAFLGPKPEGARIRHLNADRTDCRAENLRYGSASDCSYDRDARASRERIYNALKTPACPGGHPLDAYEHDGVIKCRTCVLEQVARWRGATPARALVGARSA